MVSRKSPRATACDVALPGTAHRWVATSLPTKRSLRTPRLALAASAITISKVKPLRHAPVYAAPSGSENSKSASTKPLPPDAAQPSLLVRVRIRVRVRATVRVRVTVRVIALRGLG